MAENIKETEEQATDANEEVEKKRIRFLKTVLNVYRARTLSMTSACESRISNAAVPEDYKHFEFLQKQIRGLHNEITLLKTFQDCVNVIHNSITCLSISNLSNVHLRRQIQKTVFEISFFSQSIMKLYEENINEIEIIKQKQDYTDSLSNCQKNLKILKERQRQLSLTPEELRRWEKAEMKVKKINFIREMKLILIAKFAGNACKFPSLQNLRRSNRKNLTVDDFAEKWDVGLV